MFDKKKIKYPIFDLHVCNFIQSKLRVPVIEFCKISIATANNFRPSFQLIKIASMVMNHFGFWFIDITNSIRLATVARLHGNLKCLACLLLSLTDQKNDTFVKFIS